MSLSRFAFLMTLSVLMLFVGVNLIAGVALDRWRFDFTERGLYRLSEGTIEVIDRLDEPITLRFVYSRAEAASSPSIRAYGARVRELLRGMTARSGGMIRLEEIDPAPFSPEEDEAIAAGLVALSDEEGTQLFFGLIGRNAIDDEVIIDLFDPSQEARLEYEIVRVISELERTRTPQLAIISSLPFAPDDQGRSANRIIDDLARNFDVIWLEPDFQDIPSADALFILHPPELSEAQLYLIDQYAMTRGRILAAVDPLSHVALKPGPDGLPPLQANRASDLGPLLATWGVGFDVTEVSMDRENGLPVNITNSGRTRTRPYPLWFTVPPSGFASNIDTVTALDRGINFGSPGLFTQLDEIPVQFDPVLTTGPLGARLDSDVAATSPSPAELNAQYIVAEDSPLVLATRLTGQLQSAFPDGPPASDVPLDASSHRTASAQPATLILIADSDWLDPAFYLSRDPIEGEISVADNAAFAVNFADELAGDRALVSLRSRSVSVRPMDRVETLRAAAEARYLDLQESLTLELETAQTALDELNASGRGSTLGGASQDEVSRADSLRSQIIEARTQLREIERGFRAELDELERDLIIWTVWMPPLLVMVLAIFFFLIRRRGSRA